MTETPAIIADLDLAACEREPIRVPGSIQPHGALFVLDADGVVSKAAIGALAVGVVDDPVGRKLADLLPGDARRAIESLGTGLVAGRGPEHLCFLRTEAGAFHLVAHRSGEDVIVELERATGDEPGSFDAVYPDVRAFLDAVQRTSGIQALADLAAREVRRITGLDRALIYRFDEEWNGEVIAEDNGGRLPVYLDLRWPASDIPAQARELYRLNRLRLIADANYEPAPITPDGAAVDLTYSVLRSVSPVHLEYMRNMETMASMSISLLSGERLWGLISCHHQDPIRVPYHVRAACEFIGQVVSMQIAAHEASALALRRDALRTVQGKLLAHMAAEDHFIDGLLAHPRDLMALTGADGAAVVAGGRCTRLGETPDEPAILSLVEWLSQQDREDVFVADSLAAEWPEGEALKDLGSGVVAISISQIHDSYLIWFRPELVRTVSWGGDPAKRAELGPDGLRLHPRKSFDIWKETVRLRARPWHEAEIDAARELRVAIVDIVLRRAEEMAALSERLAAINKELEAFSYSVSHDLRAPFRHIVGYAQLLKKFEGERLSERGDRYIETIIESAISAGQLVDDLLSYSQMGRSTITPVSIDVAAMVDEARANLTVEGDRHRVDWRIGDLAPVRADPVMVRLVVQNLLENALKFSRDREPAVIEIGSEAKEGDVTTWVRDNGAGFDMAYVDKLFGVFQRLHREEEFEGTGIGLANVKRIVERHGGRVWAQGEPDRGATFFFALPAA
ncbi:GAF domain-containing protein [Sphingomonas sp. CGMCC 1.13654]|uniref:histidine kinase n=1 Tax=Sphingomonas chungangi TaxID=2683589 RepID=A0A838L4C3_9SPHN|nr:ATP-binding protein [Sphingomonas chungangi]MBA2934221.1 GAF domain-containing protein [Sphingomonas chungangi]MVW57262.1 GAF domain-containing protein [Sphingomonas chungangi]